MNRDRLATVVRVRRVQEQIARGEVARGRGEVAVRERAAATATELLDEVATTAPDTVAGFVAHRRMLDGGVRDIARANDEVTIARTCLDETIRGWTAAAQRLDGVERLDERVAAEHELLTERADRAELDDLVVMRWTDTGERSRR